MNRLIDHLKGAARILHKRASLGHETALRRLGVNTPASLQRRHCLAVIARERGFESWKHATAVITGANADDFGTLLYPRGASAHWNIWSASYEEARKIREQHGGYLLAWRNHFFIVDGDYMEMLGVSADDPDWDAIGRDWVNPRGVVARERLYEKIISPRL